MTGGNVDVITFYDADWTGDRDPWMKWYPDLWNNDLELMACSLRSQALLARLTAVLHHARPYAFLTWNGKHDGIKCRCFEDVLYMKSLSKAVGMSQKTFSKLLSELLEHGALKQHELGIYSKRMRQEWEKTQFGRLHGQQGGNPDLVAGRDNGGVNPPVKAPLNVRSKNKNKNKNTHTEESVLERYAHEFEEDFWPLVAKQEAADPAQELFISLRASGIPLEDLRDGLLEYQREKFAAGTELRYYMQPKRFLGPEKHWREYAAKVREREAQEAERKRQISEREPTPEEQAAKAAFIEEARRHKEHPPCPISERVPDEVLQELGEKRKAKEAAR
ncbi:MAG: hypothetical protein ACYC99_17335 [Candidatus Geothermincolia bacterium]